MIIWGVVVLDDPRNVAIKPRFDLDRDHSVSAFCRENDVNNYLDQRLGHLEIIPMFVAYSDARLRFANLGLRSARRPRVAANGLTLGFIGLSPLATLTFRPFRSRVAAESTYPPPVVDTPTFPGANGAHIVLSLPSPTATNLYSLGCNPRLGGPHTAR